MKITTPSNNILNNVLQQQQKLAQQEASGKRITSAADDAAGLQISNRLNSAINGQQQGQRNIADGVAFARVYEQAVQGVSDNVNEIERLAIAAGNGIYSDADKQALQSEANGYLANIQQGLTTEFAGKKLFEDTALSFNAGNSNLQLQTQDLGAALNSQNLFSIDLTQPQTLTTVRAVAEQLNALQTEVGASINAFDSASRAVSGQQVATSEARSRIADLDYAKASSERAANNILSQSSVNVAMQARVSSEQALSLLS
ncbi:flagellin [Alishewanella sp. SMS8]|uniref:flagellin n=1 Tax=Alishewanella sp. SMS8 TaxID=2994676 RepID=UPI0027410D0F|nr:flagellin [Alishewanella sp. SMS8]MDP5034630.1 flagellin [Alishewanella sp.]MDP5186458.1 flagellin [Alishewanella sp.]MDP5459943.1 flagellin [Alishewanella sp. SMS8]